MDTKEIKKEINTFVSLHEIIISEIEKIKNEDTNVHFTTFGSRAASNALYDVIKMLDDDTKIKVIEMMRELRRKI